VSKPTAGMPVEVLDEEGRVFFAGHVADSSAPWVGWHRVTADGPVDLPPKYTIRVRKEPPSPDTVLLRELLTREARELEDTIRTAEALSVPTEPGKWRWADVRMDGYHRKSESELREMYQRNCQKAAEARKRLALVKQTMEGLS